MIRLIRGLVSKMWHHAPSSQTLEAEERLEAVRDDDNKVDDIIRRQRQLLRENHLGPMIAELFERRHQTR